MGEPIYGIGEGPATRVSLSLPEGTAEAIRARVGKREFSAFIAEAVERELRGQVLDEYLAVAMTAEARSRGMEAVISALTIIEAVHARIDKARLHWVLSGSRVVPVGEEEAKAASKLLMYAGLHGHDGPRPAQTLRPGTSPSRSRSIPNGSARPVRISRSTSISAGACSARASTSAVTIRACQDR